MLRSGFEPESLARKAVKETIDFKKAKEGFSTWMRAMCSIEHAKVMVSYLDKYLTMPISNQLDLFALIETVEKGKRHLCMGIRDLLKYYEAFSLMDDESLTKYRKVVKIPRTNTDNFIPEDEKVILAFEKVEDERYRILFKLLAFSGIRLKEAVYLLNNLDEERIITNGEIAKYPLSLERKTKRVFYAYMPKEFVNEVERMDLEETRARQHIARQLPSKYLRKWNYNFLILNYVPESVADYIQGRAPSTIGSMHYLAKTQQADIWYAKVVPKLLEILK